MSPDWPPVSGPTRSRSRAAVLRTPVSPVTEAFRRRVLLLRGDLRLPRPFLAFLREVPFLLFLLGTQKSYHSRFGHTTRRIRRRVERTVLTGGGSRATLKARQPQCTLPRRKFHARSHVSGVAKGRVLACLQDRSGESMQAPGPVGLDRSAETARRGYTSKTEISFHWQSVL